MKIRILFILLSLFNVSFCAGTTAENTQSNQVITEVTSQQTKPLRIILKLDDLKALNGTCAFKPILDYLIEKQVKAGLGAIADYFDNTSIATLSAYINATNGSGDKIFEVWHHGLNHVDPEFKGTTYDYQKAHFDQATQKIITYLGVQMHSFGTPFNASDANTSKVMSEDPDYKVFIFPSIDAPATTKILNMDNRVNMENGTGNPEYSYFVTNFNNNKTKYTDYMVLQGHPNSWTTTTKKDQFKQIIEFLILQGCEFVLPYDYYCSLTLLAPTNLTAQVVSATQVNLSWADNTSSEYNYKIERSTDAENWTIIGTASKNSTNYSDNSLSVSGGLYYYRVYANCGIKSDYSNVINTNEYSAIKDVKGNTCVLASIIVKKNEISIENITDKVLLHIFDTSGKQMFVRELKTFEKYMFPMKSGVYFVRLSNNEISQTEKVIL